MNLFLLEGTIRYENEEQKSQDNINTISTCKSLLFRYTRVDYTL